MRNWIVATVVGVIGVGAALFYQPEPSFALSGEGVEVTGKGKFWHYHGPIAPGAKTFVNKVKPGDIVSCISQSAPGPKGFSCPGNQIEVDAEGKAFVFFDSPTSWRFATNRGGTNATTLTGFVGGKGEFLFIGKHALSDTTFVLQGKAKFAKGTLNVTKIKGKIMALSPMTEHFGIGSIKSTGQAFGPTAKK